MVTRRRYSVTVKKKVPQPAQGAEVRLRSSQGDREPPMRAATKLPQENWWLDWKSATTVVILVIGVGVSLYLLKGQEISYDANVSSGSSAASAPVSSAPSNSPSRRIAGARSGSAQSSDYSRSGSTPDLQAGSAESFLAFSRTAKAANGGAPPVKTSPLPAGTSSSQVFEEDRKVVLPGTLSGECSIAGGSVKELVTSVGDCFKSHGARVVE